MNYTVDLILAVAVLAFTVMGAAKGFVKTVLSFAAVIVAAILARTLMPSFAEQIYSAFIHERLVETIAEKLGAAANDIGAALPESVRLLAAAFGLDINAIISQMGSSLDLNGMAEYLTVNIAQPVVMIFVRALTAVAIFFVLMAIFRVAIRIINRIFKLPVLKTANKGLGAVLGFFKGIAVVMLVGNIIFAFAGLSANPAIQQAVDNSHIVKLVCEVDIFDVFESITNAGGNIK